MSHLLTEGMRVRTLNPNLSFASAKKIVCCVWNSLLTRSPLFIMLRLLGQQANCERMSCLFETTSRRWLIVMDWFEIHVEALSVVPISLAVLVRIGEQIDPVTSSKAAKIILKCASHMSAWDAAVGQVGLLFSGVFPSCAKSNARMVWLLFIAVTMANEVAGAKALDAHRSLCALFIFVTASHLSSSSLVRLWLVIKALSAHVWPWLRIGRRACTTLCARTTSVRGFDQVPMSLIQMGPMGLEMLHRTLPMLLLEIFPLIAVVL